MGHVLIKSTAGVVLPLLRNLRLVLLVTEVGTFPGILLPLSEPFCFDFVLLFIFNSKLYNIVAVADECMCSKFFNELLV